MSQKTIYICDACGHKEEKSTNFSKLTFSLGRDYVDYTRWGAFQFSHGNSFELCTACLSKLGIKKKEKEEKPLPKAPADQLYNLISDIVSECIQQ